MIPHILMMNVGISVVMEGFGLLFWEVWIVLRVGIQATEDRIPTKMRVNRR